MSTKTQQKYQMTLELAKNTPKEYIKTFVNLIKLSFYSGILGYLLHILSNKTFWTKFLTEYNNGDNYLFGIRWKVFEIDLFNLSWVGDVALCCL